MPRIVALALIMVVSLAWLPDAAHAQECTPGALTQHDMAGVYVNPESPMRVEVYPCGGIYLQWDNAYGTHRAVYGATNRLPGGGVAATGLRSERGVFLDDSARLGVKPAEPGYVQVITLGVYDETFRVYRLKKIA